MQFNQTMIDEFTLLAKFPLSTKMQGLKLHSDAEESLKQAAQRLFEKGVIDSPDGGYLTELGLDLIEHVTVLHSALGS
ncbi:TIGR02647 family protein [Pseudoalteromonas sp. NEC-BIFX-2020_002]|uniref:DNA-binding protein n=2 Tax=Pseudoalteromonas TaxID=53246 RepID=A0A0N0LV97_9GAMM|nr:MULTISPECIES: TIGR02647 family protein [Pseudoalteromonas]KPH58018.1 DNA-binding protein [Pseudoalteromonas porphyrae]NMR26858.1 TIGR02647 family protein [Pseudoalteromonas sp. NEC-BIFX-2020_015]NNG43168.1 TIGR02647 family protein [Pseudoalteromonas sp. NEC-BIFX-2020_002]